MESVIQEIKSEMERINKQYTYNQNLNDIVDEILNMKIEVLIGDYANLLNELLKDLREVYPTEEQIERDKKSRIEFKNLRTIQDRLDKLIWKI